MTILRRFMYAFAMCFCLVPFVLADGINMTVSGPGVVNDSTLKAGEKVTFDIACGTDIERTGFTFGFVVKSPDIAKVIHVVDSGNGLNPAGDVKGHNGWADRSYWDFSGVMVVEKDWDGKLPELLGFGGLSIKKSWMPSEMEHSLSFEMIVPSTGTLVIDSAYYPPGGKWMFSSPPRIGDPSEPDWNGPLTFKVIK